MNNNVKLPEMFGMMVFSDHVMKRCLPDDIYKALQKTIQDGTRLNTVIADAVAEKMKQWAIDLGATHYTHWFQPMTGITAEKHDSFVSPTGDGRAIMEFSRSALVSGEADASSFPSGGLRATFEARGYTAWDPTSYAFVRGSTLYIPTAFCSYGGEALDEKTPLLRSMQAIDKQAVRVLRLFGDSDVTSVTPMAGAEQEYFLIDKAMYEQRKDLMYTGRTLFGAKSPKGQELDDQYYGAIKPRVSAYMKALDEELWKLGVPAKTKHNESAPAQHELAAVYTTTNLATDHNQLIMEIMQTIAKEHEMICTLHEKPFDGINGSGKHVNWSLATGAGINLFEPGATPHDNAVFLLFLIAVLKAVDDHQDLLRISTASAGNDCRLGSGEAPPAIISAFIGDELFAILEAIESGLHYNASEKTEMTIGASVLPNFPKDTTDRNRTSPFAFTGNKFEFRMVGSKMSIAKANTILNTIVAESLRAFADELESADDFNTCLQQLIKRTIKEHKRILFNGNSYGDEWVTEAKERGLLNLKTTPDALPYMISDKNIELFEKHRVFSRSELLSRYEIGLENYCKLCNIEAITMYKIIKKNILPMAALYTGKLSEAAVAKMAFIADYSDCTYERDTVKRLSELLGGLHKKEAELLSELYEAEEKADLLEKAYHYKDVVLPKMGEIRQLTDEMELMVSRKHWPLPTYGDLLFSVR